MDHRNITPDLELWQLHERLRSIVEGELGDDEEILWVAQPRARRAAARTFAIWLFAVPWTGFAVFWIVKAWQSSQSTSGGLPFPVLGIPFVLAGLAMMSAPLWKYRAARRTVMVITNQRAIRIHGGRSIAVQSWAFDEMTTLERNQGRDGWGNLTFSERAFRDAHGDRRVRHEGFFDVPNVAEVERLVRELREG